MYTTAKALLITRQVELIGKKKFVVIALDQKNEVFVIHVAFISINSDIYSCHKA